MHIRSQQQHPGSGVLSVRVIADGPTNVLEINHLESIDVPTPTNLVPPQLLIYNLNLHFPSGVGISLIGSVGHESEEFIYVLVNNIRIEYNDKNNEQSIEGTIESLIVYLI